MARKIKISDLSRFEDYLKEDEKSSATVEKYLRDVKAFLSYIGDRDVKKGDVLDYKRELLKKYAVSSANTMLTALSKYFKFIGKDELCVKQYKVQRQTFCPKEKELTREEYKRLVETASRRKNKKLALLIQTICSSGIRVSELSFITTEAAKRGEAIVSMKGKSRVIFIIPALRKKLLRFAAENGIKSGPIFRSSTGGAIDRTTVWRQMKALCSEAEVSAGKVFPHNLRHLFARTFWGLEKDIVKLADVLGHSSINTTRIYIITSGEEHKRNMENLRLLI